MAAQSRPYFSDGIQGLAGSHAGSALTVAQQGFLRPTYFDVSD
jgi:hypothetical protein